MIPGHHHIQKNVFSHGRGGIVRSHNLATRRLAFKLGFACDACTEADLDRIRKLRLGTVTL